MEKKKIIAASIVVLLLFVILIIVTVSSCKNNGEQGTTTTNNVEESRGDNSESDTTTGKEAANEAESNDETSSSDETSDEDVSDAETTDVESTDGESEGSSETIDNVETTKESATKNTEKNTSADKTTEASKEEASSSGESETTKPSDSSNDNDSIVINPNLSTMTTAQIVKDMGIGINLGNTFESCGDWFNGSCVEDFETAWGSPVIEKKMIQGMAAEGFGVLRIPVAWSNMMDENYNIDPTYIARVKEIVDWTLDSGMYAIVNIHYDGGWWKYFPTDKTNCMNKYKAIWTQLADAFGEYDERLMFESLNEEGVWDSVWNRYGGTTGKTDAYGLLNEINQTFVNIVRNSGGKNTYRHLLIAGYATDITLTCDSCFKMPNDPQNRCAVSVHYYNPFGYTHLEEDESWASVQTVWGSDADKAELKKYMKMMYDTFASKGVSVIIGEFGVPMMSNKTDLDNVVFYLKSVAETAYDYGMCPVLWDTTSDYSYYNRKTCSMSEYPTLKEAFSDILN